MAINKQTAKAIEINSIVVEAVELMVMNQGVKKVNCFNWCRETILLQDEDILLEVGDQDNVQNIIDQ